MLDNLVGDALPFAGLGIGGAIPYLIIKMSSLESNVKTLQETVKKQQKTFGVYYFYLSRKDTNFGNFMEKHERRL